MQKILGSMRKAIEEFHMIDEGDKIAVALSGGKDSITLLMALKNLQRFYPKKFDLIIQDLNFLTLTYYMTFVKKLMLNYML